MKNPKQNTHDEQQRESGMPGGGAGRKDEVGRSGVYPMSGPLPPGHAEIRGQASWGQGERGAEGYQDHGSSALSYEGGQVLGGYTPGPGGGQDLNLQIPADGVTLQGILNVPAAPRGAVLFAHGSGSSRHSPRNQQVARFLQEASIATLLFDLLTEDEELLDRQTFGLRFDIGLLARRLLKVTDWLAQQPLIKELKIGYFGASTGAAAALVAAVESRQPISAVVSRGGRPDLAGPTLINVKVPTLFIVGGEDTVVLDLHRQVIKQFKGERRLEVIRGATHLFEEPGALEQVARLAREWFERRLGRRQDKVRAA